MFIGSLVFELLIDDAFSLKDRRRVVSSFKQKLKGRFNISVAEVGETSLWNVAHVAVVTVGNSRPHVDKILQDVLAYVDSLEFNIGVIEQEIT